MTPTEAIEYLDRLRARGIVVALDGSALDVSGPFTAVDAEQLRLYAEPVSKALRAQAESNERRAAQPETQPAPDVPPTPPEPSVLLARYEEERRARNRTFRGRAITRAELDACLRSSGDLDAYRAGELSADEAYERTHNWLRASQIETLVFQSLV